MKRYNCYSDNGFVGKIWANDDADAWEVANKKWPNLEITDVVEE